MIDTLEGCEHQIRDKTGAEYSLRIRPYRNAENKIDGAVITLVDLKSKPGAKKKSRS